MTLQQCTYVLKIAECGSFNEAAKQLFIAQSSISVSVKSLERELGIRIFQRVGNGIFLTEEGAEFIRYARQIVEQSNFIYHRYSEASSYRRLFVSTQHYDFVADHFTKLINSVEDSHYRFSLREMKTYDVIREVETAYCDIGVIAIKDTDLSVMERYLNQRGMKFNALIQVSPHVYIRSSHPVSDKSKLSAEDMKQYPYISYEQGEHSNSFFTEELANITSDKLIEISDRASLMNCLLGTDGYTIGTGIMPSILNDGRILSIPFDSDDSYTIGYILRDDKLVSDLTERFIGMLKESVC